MSTAARYPNGYEQRAAVELRAAAGRRLQGRAIAFNSPAQIGDFTETVLPGACQRSLAAPGADVLALYQHDPAQILGRTTAGTLSLRQDAAGVEFTLEVPRTSLGDDVLELVRRGDIRGCSFGFICVQDRWESRDKRQIVELDLREISLVSVPAYGAATSVAIRSRPGALPGLATPAALRRMLESL